MIAESSLSLLYRRAGFGATSQELSAARALGYDGLLSRLLQGLYKSDPAADAIKLPEMLKPPFYKPGWLNTPAAINEFNQTLYQERVELTNWWLGRMVATSNPLREKLTFFLHCHFPTAISKVRFPFYMYRQNEIFRSQGAGDFRNLTMAVSTDPAMLIWLDAGTDKLPDPNENFARELMERFTMGIGTYSELDVRSAAMVFTGWHLNSETGEFAVVPKLHSNRPQIFLGKSGVSTGQEVVDIVTASDACARFVVSSAWSRFAYPIKPSDPLVGDLALKYLTDRNMANLIKTIFEHPNFRSVETSTGLIKQPVKYLVGALKALGVSAAHLSSIKPPIINSLAGLGQVLFDPPSVGGWPQNEYWLSTSAVLARWRLAHQLSLIGDISLVSDAPSAARVEAVAQLLSITGWSSSTLSALKGAVSNPHTLVVLALVSPEYVTN